MTTYATADLCDRFGAQAQVCRAPLRPYGRHRAAQGLIDCLQCCEDAASLRTQLARPGNGRILVVDGGASLRVALLGDRMARMAIDNGWGGVVINGAVRDVGHLQSMDFAVWALGHVPLRAHAPERGRPGVELSFGQAVFRPGDFICLDQDGVVVLSQALLNGFAI